MPEHDAGRPPGEDTDDETGDRAQRPPPDVDHQPRPRDDRVDPRSAPYSTPLAEPSPPPPPPRSFPPVYPPGPPASPRYGTGPPPGGPAPSPWMPPLQVPIRAAGRAGRRRALWIALVVLGVVAVVVSGTVVLFTTSSTPSGSSSVSPSAKRLLEVSLSAARRAGTFHYESSFASQGAIQHTVGDAGPDSGRQVISIGPHSFTVLVIGTACYFSGDAVSAQSQLGLSAPVAEAHAGQWLSLSPSDRPYRAVYEAVTASSALTDNIAFKPQHELGTSTIGDRTVRSIRGAMTDFSVGGQVQRARGAAQFELAASMPHVPVRYSEHGSINGQRVDFAMVFSHWGERVDVVAPSGAVSFSSLGPENPAGPPGPTTLV